MGQNWARTVLEVYIKYYVQSYAILDLSPKISPYMYSNIVTLEKSNTGSGAGLRQFAQVMDYWPAVYTGLLKLHSTCTRRLSACCLHKDPTPLTASLYLRKFYTTQGWSIWLYKIDIHTR